MDGSEKFNKVLRILNIAFYRFQPVSELEYHREFFRKLCKKLELKGTILLSTEGVNSTLAGTEDSVRQFQLELNASSLWKGLQYKESFSQEIPFQNLYVKLKKEFIPVGDSTIEPAKETAPTIAPTDLKQWLDEKREFTFLDTRNDYEVRHGTFKGAKDLKLKTFRQFREKLREMDPTAKTRPMVMFCTGGIRCEKASVVAFQEGFREVYQLAGGILNYFEECGGAHYEGNCFVFDERVAVDPDLKPLTKDESPRLITE